MIICSKLFFAFQILTVCAKCDALIQWDWGSVFWFCWLFSTVLVSFAILFLIFSLLKLCTGNVINKRPFDEIYPLFWFFFVFSGLSFVSAGLVLGVIYYIEEDSSIFLDLMLIVMECFFGIGILTAWLLRKSIWSFFTEMINYYNFDYNKRRSELIRRRNLEGESQNERQSSERSQPKEKNAKKVLMARVKVSIPIYLVNFFWERINWEGNS